uniref:RNA-dependent RNA polymerase n=1 Tax=Tasmanian devil-associated picobirnavirus 5 TaxID=2529457 RepID=A0A481W7J7_9VIRU|nr:MAG: RNA-dependent RNA polymerase [Tasmanian devil-associated picobirnavirus 5]
MKGGFTMNETKLNSNLLSVIDNNNGLRNYLDGLLTGKEATPRSSLYNLSGKTEMLEPDEILERWMQHLNSLKGSDPFSENVFQFDSHQLEKWGPQGAVAPISELMDEIVLPTFSGSKKIPKAFNSSAWATAKANVVQTLYAAGAYRLQPVSYKRVIDDMRVRDTLESNSGWPLFTKRNKPEVIAQSIREAETGLWETYPAIALFRNYNQKTRLVWMFPMSANLVEGSFFQPLQSVLIKSRIEYVSEFLSPWKGFEHVRMVVDETYKSGLFESIAASDFSATDAHFQLHTTMEVFDVIKHCFQRKYWGALRESLIYMHRIPLIVGPNTMLVGEHGVSSGSNWTNFVETIFDMILSEYVSILTLDNASGLYAIGDDMAWKLDQFDEHFAESLSKFGKDVGQEIKADKTTNDLDKVKSLQRLFQRGYLRPDGTIRAVYSTVRALKSLVYPERFHKPQVWTKDMEAIRDFMILENCVDHPLFHEFCSFVASGDPHLKEFANYSAAKQQNLLRQSKLLPGLNTTYNQEKRDQSLASFESVKFISTIS